MYHCKELAFVEAGARPSVTSTVARFSPESEATLALSPALRAATFDDIPAIADLIARSADQLSKGFYDAAQRRAAIAHVFGVDRQLIADGMDPV